jgi:hypothetical protein
MFGIKPHAETTFTAEEYAEARQAVFELKWLHARFDFLASTGMLGVLMALVALTCWIEGVTPEPGAIAFLVGTPPVFGAAVATWNFLFAAPPLPPSRKV